MIDKLEQDLYAEWKPRTATEKILVDDMVRGERLIRRLDRAEAALLTECPDDLLKQLNQLDLIRNRARGRFHKALAALQSMREVEKKAITTEMKLLKDAAAVEPAYRTIAEPMVGEILKKWREKTNPPQRPSGPVQRPPEAPEFAARSPQ